MQQNSLNNRCCANLHVRLAKAKACGKAKTQKLQPSNPISTAPTMQRRLTILAAAAATAGLVSVAEAQSSAFSDISVATYSSGNLQWPTSATGFVVTATANYDGDVKCVAYPAGTPAPTAEAIFNATANPDPTPLCVAARAKYRPRPPAQPGRWRGVCFL